MAPPGRTRLTHAAASTNNTPPTDPTPPAASSGTRKSKRKSPAGINDSSPTGDETPQAPPPKVRKPSNRATSTKKATPNPALPPPVPATIPTEQVPLPVSAHDNTAPSLTDQSTETGGLEHPEEAHAGASASTSAVAGIEDAPLDDLAAANAAYAALQKEVRTLKKYKVMWAKQQMEKTNLPQDEVSDGSIPRPPGERGKNGWNMQTALQLEADGDTYNAILATTRDAVRQAGLDWHFKFDEQEPARLGAAYSQVKRSHPYLKRFKNDWACRELVLAALQNRRKTEAAKINRLTAKSPSKKPAKSKRNGFKPRSKSTAPTAGPSNGDGDGSMEESSAE
ncbi:hypothetical protein FRB90_001284 [Tulasnella sp. 427]|nr:hypothetical protein FRB90_001284 [Tulasnella sp. 427]